MIYTEMFSYITNVAQSSLTSNTVIVSNAIAPAVTSLLGLYVILWGVLSIRGSIQEPFTDAATRIVKVSLICWIALQLGHYNEMITDTFMNGPEDLAQMLTGATNANSTMSSLDAIFSTGFGVAKGFWDKGGVLTGDMGMYLIAIIVWATTIAVTVYSFLLVALAKVMLCVIIGFGPLFIVSLLFETTRNYFIGWIHQMANFGLLSILAIATNMVFMTMFKRAADNASTATQIDHIMPMLVTGIVVFAVLAQLTSVAAGMAGGLSLSTQGAGRLGLSALSGAAGKAGSLLKFGGKGKPTPPAPKPLPRKEPRKSEPLAITYENRDNQIGPPP